MKIALDFVKFNGDVYGPGPKTDGQGGSFNGNHFVSIRADQATREEAEARHREHYPKNNVVDIVHDTEAQAVVLTKVGATRRPCVRVPWTSVAYAEQSLEALTAPAAKK